MASPRNQGVTPEHIEATRRELNFWAWLFAPENARGGRERWLNLRWIFHFAIAIGMAAVFKEEVSERARSVVLPLAGVLVGLTFAWAATAMTIVTSKEFRTLMNNSKQGVRGTANYFQLAIFAVLTSTVLWAIAGLGPYGTPPWINVHTANRVISCLLFAFTSFSIGECWSAVNLTRLSLLGYNTVKQVEESREEAERDALAALSANPTLTVPSSTEEVKS